MKQELIKDFKTYTRMKDITIKLISSLHLKLILLKISKIIIFNHFVNDDIKETTSFNNFFDFLYYYYFL